MLVMDWRGRARQIVDLIHFDIEGKGHIMTKQIKSRVIEEVRYMRFGTGVKVVHAKDLMPFLKESLAQMRAQESGATRDENCLCHSQTPAYTSHAMEQQKSQRRSSVRQQNNEVIPTYPSSLLRLGRLEIATESPTRSWRFGVDKPLQSV
jgi:hypothetical protein